VWAINFIIKDIKQQNSSRGAKEKELEVEVVLVLFFVVVLAGFFVFFD